MPSFPQIRSRTRPVAVGEEQQVVQVFVADTGSGSDIVAQVKALLSLQESSSLFDSVTQVKALVPTTDAAFSTEQLALLTKLPVGDVNTSSELLSVIARVSTFDSTTSSDSITSLRALLSLIDSIMSNDSVELKNFLRVNDSTLFADALGSIIVKVGMSDVGSSVDSVSVGVKALVNLADTANSNDAVSVGSKVGIADILTNSDAAVVKVALLLLEAGISTDIVSNVVNKLAVLDTVLSSETLKLLTKFLVLDSFESIEALARALKKVKVYATEDRKQAYIVQTELVKSPSGRRQSIVVEKNTEIPTGKRRVQLRDE